MDKPIGESRSVERRECEVKFNLSEYRRCLRTMERYGVLEALKQTHLRQSQLIFF